MKKVLFSLIGLTALAGCASYYDYYQGGVRYTQDGTDCIYYEGEYGNHFSGDIERLDAGKTIVYKNTLCADLYARDNAGQAPRRDRQILAPAAEPKPACNTCNSCAAAHNATYVATSAPQPIVRRHYVLTPAM